MRFQSRWSNYIKVVRASQKIILPGLGVEYKPGLIAKFEGPQRLFDSESAQEKFGWTDEEREFVEKRLLQHKDFGYGLYLAPGEELDAEKSKLLRHPERIPTKRCAYFEVTSEGIDQCSDKAILGGEYCKAHDPDRTKIRSGMSGTAHAVETAED